MTHSITKTTPSGGLAKFLISTMAFLSRLSSAFLAAKSSGLAAVRSASASSAIALASVAFLLTISASADTTFSFSSATALSAFTITSATLSSSFFYSRIGCISANLIFNSAIFLFVSLSLLSPLASLLLLIWNSFLFLSNTFKYKLIKSKYDFGVV